MHLITENNIFLSGAGKYQQFSDQQLLEAFYKTRDNEWLGVLMQRYTLLLFGVCMKYLKNEAEAKDSVQQVFLKAIGELHKYEVAYFKSWVYMVAKNHCLMQLRDKNSRRHTEINEYTELEQEAADEAALREKDITLDMMEEALNELGEGQKQCVTSFYLDKKSYQEISDSTGYSYMQVKSYIQNGKRNLKLLVEQKLKQQSANKHL